MIIEENKFTNKNPYIVEILSNDPVKFRCKICGQIWYPEWSPSSKNTELPFESWQCPNGCGKKEDKENIRDETIQDEPLII